MVQGAAFRILAVFYERDVWGFTELCESAGYPTDLGGYYLRQLVRSGYIDKLERGTYGVTPKGKQLLAVRFGKHTSGLKPRLMVLLVAQQAGQLVVLRRVVQPFIGAAEWPAGMVLAGESLLAAAARVGQDRLGYAEDLQLVGFFRRLDWYQDSLFDDKLFAVHTVAIPAEVALNTANAMGEIVRCGPAELRQLPRPAKSLLDILDFSTKPENWYEEQTYTLTLADLTA